MPSSAVVLEAHRRPRDWKAPLHGMSRSALSCNLRMFNRNRCFRMKRNSANREVGSRTDGRGNRHDICR